MTINKVGETDLVSVYGSLRKGMHNSILLKNAEYVGEFQSKPIYDMYSVQGSYPALVQNGSTSVLMEVYRVNKDTLQSLNDLEGYIGIGDPNNHYDRIIIQTPYGNAYLYIYNYSVSRHVQVESGDWVSFKNNIKLQTV